MVPICSLVVFLLIPRTAFVLRGGVARTGGDPRAAEGLSANQRTAIQWRIAQLQLEVAEKEEVIVAIKTQLGERGGRRRPGWQGEFARASETLAANEWKATEVLVKSLRRQSNPAQYLVDETAALLRLGTNMSMVTRYLWAGSQGDLFGHAPAIYARARELESFAPGLLPVST